MGRHFHGKKGRGRSGPKPPLLLQQLAPCVVPGRPAKHPEVGVMALSLAGGRREDLAAAGLTENQHAGSSSGGGSLALPFGTAGWSASQRTDLGPPASLRTGGPEWPSVSLGSQSPLSWCGASSTVQLRLVQSGLVTPLDLAGFCDSEDDVREAFRKSLSGVHLDGMVSA